MKTIILLVASLCLVLPASFAQNAAVAPATAEGIAQTSADSDLIDVNFPNDEVRNIIRSVADMNDLNVVIPDTLVGSVSIKLRQVTWRQVFSVALEPLGYTYVEEGNIIKIRSLKDLMMEPMHTQVYIVNFAKATELRPAVAPLVDEVLGGRVQVDARTNALIVTERSTQLLQIEDIIKRLDRPTDQVMIESKFIEVTDTQMSDLGLDWSSLKGYAAQAQFDRTVVREHDNNIDDARPNLYSNLEKVDTAVLSLDAFSMVLNALQTDNKVELMSNPTVVTMNNTPATIHIGNEYPIPNYRYNEQTGTFEISGFEYKPIGISLDVIPQVNNTGLINLQIKPEISSMNGTVSFGGASGAEIPIITQRRTSSTVTIKSGYTLAIGGLIQSTQSKDGTKVPLLGDIPFLGRLFRSDSDTTDRRNLVIFITAKILDPEGSTYKDVIPQQHLIDMGVGESDIPGFQPDAEQAALYERLQKAKDDADKADQDARARIQLEKMQRDAAQRGNK
ncbi:MAG: secretin N-terminal domain-containing protein [Opitutales bacterium]